MARGLAHDIGSRQPAGRTDVSKAGRCLIGVVVSVALAAGCAARASTRGERAARLGAWDQAVEHFSQALDKDPQRADYRIALVRAKLNASRAHIDAARALEAVDQLPAAVTEYRQAHEYDPSNSYTLDRVAALEREIRDRSEPPPTPLAGRAAPPPLLDPASREPLSLRFVDASLRDILDFIGNATGINVIYDSQFQDRLYSVALDDVTIEEALDLILTANGYFYKVLSPRSVAVSIR